MKRMIFPGFLIALLAAASASAVVRIVPDDYRSIQAAIQDSSDGDRIVVNPGTYYETINFGGRDIVVTSTDPNDPEIVESTIISADEDGTAVIFENGETNAAKLMGFTITGGIGTVNRDITGDEGVGAIFWGGGIYCMQASPTITRNVIADNDAPFRLDVAAARDAQISYGGGMACVECNPIITHNVFRNNSAYVAGGLIIYVGNPVISNNIFYDNAAAIGGGAILIGGSFYNNTVVGNECGLGGLDAGAGNIYIIFDPTLPCRVVNNIICSASSGGGVLFDGSPMPGWFAYNDVWNNAPANYASINAQGQLVFDRQGDLTGRSGNISADPMFVDAPGKDYHLTLDSPCINAGDPTYGLPMGPMDVDGQDRVYAFRVDIGADEYVGYVKPVAFAGPDQHILAPLQTVTLDGRQSYFYDPCGVTKYRWTQVEGAPVVLDDPNSATPAFVPDAEGRYVFELVVADDRYTGQADQVLVLVAPNQLPVADAGVDRAWPVASEAVLNGSDSYDPDVVDRLSYAWRQVEGPQVELHDANTATPSFFCDVEGQYVFELVVNDSFGDSVPSQTRHTAVSVTRGLQEREIVTTGTPLAYHPDVSGGRVVFAAGQSVQQWQITCRDLNADVTTTFSGGGANIMPRVDGSLVVWAGGVAFDRGYGPDCTSIFIREVTTATQKTLRARSDTSSFGRPAVSGDKVVWVQHLGINRNVPEQWYDMPYDICGADVTDLTNPTYFTVATGAGRCDPFPLDDIGNPCGIVDISGDVVVWEGQGDIYAADISDLDNIRIFTVCDHPARQYDPVISGRFVVWTDERNDKGDIYGADLSNLEDIRPIEVVRRVGTQQQPAVDGLQVVYIDGDSYGSLRLACMTRGHGMLDIDLPSAMLGMSPALSGTTIVWLYGSLSLIQGFSLDFGYNIADGPVQNVSLGKQYDYIQHAISGAGAGDEIVVAPGLYPEKIDFGGKAITVRSTAPADPAVVADTVIQAWGDVVTFAAGEDAGSVLDGLTVTGGDCGISCSGTSPAIRRCTITANRGAGVKLLSQSNPDISECSITGNGKAGIDMWPAGQGRTIKHNLAVLRNCIIAGNRLQGIAGGKPTVTNCTIVENLREGLFVASTTVTNSIICSNGQAMEGVQINSGNAAVTYSDIQGGWPGEGNIDADPLFVGSGLWSDPTSSTATWTAGDYHLKSQGRRWDSASDSWVADAVTSPCIDAGDPASAFLDEPVTELYGNTRINMGAYGGTAEASLAPPQ